MMGKQGFSGCNPLYPWVANALTQLVPQHLLVCRPLLAEVGASSLVERAGGYGKKVKGTGMFSSGWLTQTLL